MSIPQLILGICDNHDSGCALIAKNKIIGCLNQERIDRIKYSRYFPLDAIRVLLYKNKLKISNIDKIIVGSKMTPCALFRLFNKRYAQDVLENFVIPINNLFNKSINSFKLVKKIIDKDDLHYNNSYYLFYAKCNNFTGEEGDKENLNNFS